MHLPDGYLTPPVWAALDVAAAGVIGLSAARLKGRLPDALVPRMGLLGAFVFAAQLVNVPIAAATSGHLVGGVLVAALLGVEAATIVMTAVLVIQCLLFQDGGLLALGANVVNLGLTGTVVGYGLLRLLRRLLPDRARDVALFVAAWAAIVLSSALAAVELALSGRTPLVEGLSAMMGVHAVIGLLEGALTVAIVRFVERVRPEALEATPLARGPA